MASAYDATTTTATLANPRMWDPDVFLRGARGARFVADELPALEGQIRLNPAAEIANEIQQLNDAHRAELDRQFWDGIQWRVADNNENQAQVAPAVPEV